MFNKMYYCKDAVRELLTLQEQHRAELRIINNAQQDDTAARESLERRLSELRTEVWDQLAILLTETNMRKKINFSWNDCKQRTHLNGVNVRDLKPINLRWSGTTKN